MNSVDRIERLEKYREKLRSAAKVLSDFSTGELSEVDADDPDADIIHTVSRNTGQALRKLDEAFDKVEKRLVELED